MPQYISLAPRCAACGYGIGLATQDPARPDRWIVTCFRCDNYSHDLPQPPR